MHLKYSPRDFQVRELLDFEPDAKGDYGVYLLRKQKIDTQDALGLISRLARVSRADMAFAGLKDRQGETEQFISIKGRRIDFREPGVQLVFKGWSARPIDSKQSRGNRFHIVLRGLHRDQANMVKDALPACAESGYVNYFDDQRFGCLRHGQGFPMRDVLAGRYEKALQRLIARPSPVATGGDTRLKSILRDHWGDWDVCVRIARGPVFLPVLQHLARKQDDFAGAIQKLNSRTRLIQSFAYQSYLWNRAISSLLDELVPAPQRIFLPSLMGDLTSYRTVDPELAARFETIETPLFAPDGRRGDPEYATQIERWLHSEQLSPELCRRNTLPGMVWREEPRDLLVRPTNVYANRPERDDRQRDAYKIEVAFSLPRGVYATMLIKHLLAADASAASAPGSAAPHSAPPRRVGREAHGDRSGDSREDHDRRRGSRARPRPPAQNDATT
jgi:tRNA pseudouridine13 synthase